MSKFKETYEEMEKRHKNEKDALELTTKAMLKGVKKSAKAQIEYQVIQMQFDLKAKHLQEEDELETGNVDEVSEVTAAVADMEVSNEGNEKEKEQLALDAVDSSAESKKAKAKRKQDKKAQKEAERLAVKEQIKEANSGPSLREVELDRISAKLKSIGCEMKHVTADGNCLYRAISDQVTVNKVSPMIPAVYLGNHSSSTPTSTVTFQLLRIIAANYIRKHHEEFTPFLEMSAEDSEFEVYCNKVESEVLCEWGGQLEIKALCAALNIQIEIYSADAPMLLMGDDTSEENMSSGEAMSAKNNSSSGSSSDSKNKPLRISFHKHYFALGEHYNSVIPVV